jgi:hypothetical protein
MTTAPLRLATALESRIRQKDHRGQCYSFLWFWFAERDVEVHVNEATKIGGLQFDKISSDKKKPKPPLAANFTQSGTKKSSWIFLTHIAEES